MARANAKAVPATGSPPAPADRPWPVTAAVTAVLVAASGFLLWAMRIEVITSGALAPHIAEVKGRVFPDGTRLREVYTGWPALDSLLLLLVGAFLAGPANWDPVIRLQQVYLLLTFAAAVGIASVESCRARNRWRVLSFTTVWSVAYQTIGGGIVYPFLVLACVVPSRARSYWAAGRAVSPAHARALLPAVALGYVAPTVLMYAPQSDDAGLTQLKIAAWQFAPVYVNVLLFLLTFSLYPAPSEAGGPRRDGADAEAEADIPALKRLYWVLYLVAAATHVGTLATVLGPWNPDPARVSLATVFVPSVAHRSQGSPFQAVHYVFQWDVWGIYGAGLFWCLVELWDLLRLGVGLGVQDSEVKARAGSRVLALAAAALFLAAGSVVVGPAAVMAAFWMWREDKLARVERRLSARAKLA